MKNTPKLRALGDVALIERNAILPSQIKESDFYLGLEDIEGGTGRIVAYRPAIKAELKSAKFKFTKHHILYGKLRPYLNKVVMPDRDGVCSTDILPILPKKDIMNRDYLAYFMRSARFVELASTRSSGANLPRLSPSELSKFKVACPALEIQIKLASILKKTESVLEKRREAIRLLDDFLKSTFLEMFGDPGSNPFKWPVEKMQHIAVQVTDGEHITPKRTTEGIKLLSARNVKNGFMDFSRGVDYISIDEYKRIAKRCCPQFGDILISCSGTVGRVCTVDVDEPFNLVRSVALIKPRKELVASHYLEFYLRTNYMQKVMLRSVNKSSQANLFTGQIKDLPVVLPPIEKQEEFSILFQKIKELKRKMKSSETELQNLFNALMHKAFREHSHERNDS